MVLCRARSRVLVAGDATRLRWASADGMWCLCRLKSELVAAEKIREAQERVLAIEHQLHAAERAEVSDL